MRKLDVMPTLEMVKEQYQNQDYYVFDFQDLGHFLNMSIISKDLSPIQATCVFLKNKEKHTAVFYDETLQDNLPELHLAVMKTIVRVLNTQTSEFVLSDNEKFSTDEWEIMFELLMPQKMVEKALNNLLLPTTKSLADIFCVPQPFVNARLKPYIWSKKIAGYDY